MGIEDKITGRIKQAAGDLLGHDGLKRQGAQEERKADVEIKREEARVQAADAEADRKAAEARELELKTDPVELADSRSREQLYEEARKLGIQGRSDMSKDELAAEITARK